MRSEQDILAALDGLQTLPSAIVSARKLTAGASADTWLLACAEGQQLVLRLDSGGEAFGGSAGKVAEARAQQLGGQAGAPVAEVVDIFEQHPQLGSGYLMAFCEGESLGNRILKEERFELARTKLTEQCAQALAAIHSVSAEQAGFLAVSGAAEQLDFLYRVHLDYAEHLPVFSAVYGWLRKHLPTPEKPVLVHGDFRLGNFLVDEQGLAAVLDWELVHLGDPLEDLGWLCVKAWRFQKPENPAGGFGSYQALIDAYQAASGRPVDLWRLKYWQLFGTFRWGVICQYQAYTHLRGDVRSLERAAIGRRVAETEYDMLLLLNELLNESPEMLPCR